MKEIRKSRYTGQFYPGDATELASLVTSYISSPRTVSPTEDVLGVISPHAGYVYSGPCAGYSYHALANKHFSTAVIIAPSHHSAGFSWSVGDFSAYDTPLGRMQVNRSDVATLLAMPGSVFNRQVHEIEHALEVQLPFLQILRPQASIVPILLGNQTPGNSEELANLLWQQYQNRLQDTVFIVSSDASHYHDASMAEKIDGRTARLIEDGDIGNLGHFMMTRELEACGFGGILTLMHLAQKSGYNGIKTLQYTHSGKVNGDFHRVVGYLATMFYKEERA